MSPNLRSARRDISPVPFLHEAPPGRDALVRMLSEVERMYEYEEVVVLYETFTAAGPGSADRDRYRRLLLDELVDTAHLAHRHLRHDDPDVRREAEALTVGTADLIGRLYYPPARSPVE